ncbi:hypothetical protein QBC35DRAFT_507054 [Podospora australis]|uniref:Uncharacterized protein n=1 Tax=Podospora australis TaxID=1536484 RepID=A0AAN7AFG1_9PEZI|nr:hypothetical protein QBC35DRAFT_507054 [Podospora australis]
MKEIGNSSDASWAAPMCHCCNATPWVGSRNRFSESESKHPESKPTTRDDTKHYRHGDKATDVVPVSTRSSQGMGKRAKPASTARDDSQNGGSNTNDDEGFAEFIMHTLFLFLFMPFVATPFLIRHAWRLWDNWKKEEEKIEPLDSGKRIEKMTEEAERSFRLDQSESEWLESAAKAAILSSSRSEFDEKQKELVRKLKAHEKLKVEKEAMEEREWLKTEEKAREMMERLKAEKAKKAEEEKKRLEFETKFKKITEEIERLLELLQRKRGLFEFTGKTTIGSGSGSDFNEEQKELVRKFKAYDNLKAAREAAMEEKERLTYEEKAKEMTERMKTEIVEEGERRDVRGGEEDNAKSSSGSKGLWEATRILFRLALGTVMVSSSVRVSSDGTGLAKTPTPLICSSRLSPQS